METRDRRSGTFPDSVVGFHLGPLRVQLELDEILSAIIPASWPFPKGHHPSCPDAEDGRVEGDAGDGRRLRAPVSSSQSPITAIPTTSIPDPTDRIRLSASSAPFPVGKSPDVFVFGAEDSELLSSACRLRRQRRGHLVEISGTSLATPHALVRAIRFATQPSLLHHRLLLLHASSVVLDDGAHVFVARSGTGKSTLAQRLVRAGARLLGDEVALVGNGGAEVHPGQLLHGTPGDGAPLAAIHLLGQSQKSRNRETRSRGPQHRASRNRSLKSRESQRRPSTLENPSSESPTSGIPVHETSTTPAASTPVRPARAVAELLEAAMVYEDGPGVAESVLAVVESLVTAVPVFRTTVPNDDSALDLFSAILSGRTQ